MVIKIWILSCFVVVAIFGSWKSISSGYTNGCSLPRSGNSMDNVHNGAMGVDTLELISKVNCVQKPAVTVISTTATTAKQQADLNIVTYPFSYYPFMESEFNAILPFRIQLEIGSASLSFRYCINTFSAYLSLCWYATNRNCSHGAAFDSYFLSAIMHIVKLLHSSVWVLLFLMGAFVSNVMSHKSGHFSAFRNCAANTKRRIAFLVFVLVLFSTASATVFPTVQPTKQPTHSPTSSPPSRAPSVDPTWQPTCFPSTYQPSCLPTVLPTRQPTALPSVLPTRMPTKVPSCLPSKPSVLPTCQPSCEPTTFQPSHEPSSQPSSQPTCQPSCKPTTEPTTPPSVAPTTVPTTAQPSRQPSFQPSAQPTNQPTCEPTVQPSSNPTRIPTVSPSKVPAPRLNSAVFASSGASIYFLFDVQIDIVYAGIISYSWPCNALLQFNWNNISSCNFVNRYTINAVLPGGVSGLPNPGDIVSIQNSKLQEYCDPSVTICYPRSLSNSLDNLVKLTIPSDAFSPVAILNGPAKIGQCDDVTLDASLSYGGGGRAWRSVVWDVASNDIYSDLSVIAALQKYLDQTAVPITVSRFLFGIGNYNFTLTVQNFLLRNATTSLNIALSVDEKIPQVLIYGPKYFTVYRNAIIRLQADGQISACTDVVGSLNFNWSVYAENSLLPQLSSESKNPRLFLLSPYLLNAATNYTFHVMAYSQYGSATAVVQISVVHGPIVAFIIGGNNRTQTFDESLTLDASSSYDIDFGTSDNLHFSWSCSCISKDTPNLIQPCSIAEFSSQINSQIINLSPLVLTVWTNYTFELNCTSTIDGRSGATSVLIVSVPPLKATSILFGNESLHVNAEDSLNIYGRCQSFLPCTSFWDIVAENSLNAAYLPSLANISATPLQRSFTTEQIGNGVLFVLSVRGGSLQPGGIYSFRLSSFPEGYTMNVSFAQVTVNVNAPPIAGIIGGSPVSGLAYNTSFTVFATGWVSANGDYPFQYDFAYNLGNEFPTLSINLKGVKPYASTVLPSGLFYPHLLKIVSGIYTTYDAKASDSTFLTVLPNDAFQVTTYLRNDSAQSTSTSNANLGIVTVNNVVSYIAQTGCQYAPNCSALNRRDCSASSSSQSCGHCFDGFVGVIGSSNIPCIVAQDLSANGSCLNDANCPFGTCSGTNTCITASRSCPTADANLTCSGNGNCTFYDPYGSPMNRCYGTDRFCTAVCSCKDGYGGSDCNFETSVVLQQDSARASMCQTLMYIISIQDLSVLLLDSLSSSLNEIIQTKGISDVIFGTKDDGSLGACMGVLLNVTSIASNGFLANLNTTEALLKVISKYTGLVAAGNIWSLSIPAVVSDVKLELAMAVTSATYLSNDASTSSQLREATASLQVGVLGSMVDGQSPVAVSSDNLHMIVKRDLLTDIQGSVQSAIADGGEGLISSFQLPSTGLDTCRSFPSGYANLSLTQWLVSPFPQSSILKASLLSWSTVSNSLSDARVKRHSTYTIIVRLNNPVNFTYHPYLYLNRTVPVLKLFDSSGLMQASNCTPFTYTPVNATFVCSSMEDVLCPPVDPMSTPEFTGLIVREFGMIESAIEAILTVNPLGVNYEAAVTVSSIIAVLLFVFLIGFVVMIQWDYIDRRKLIYVSRLPTIQSRRLYRMKDLVKLRLRFDEAFKANAINAYHFLEDDFEYDKRKSWFRIANYIPESIRFADSLTVEGNSFIRFVQACMRHHPFLSFLIGKSMDNTRTMRLFELFKAIMTFLFTSIILLSLYFSSGNNCFTRLSKNTCLATNSVLVSGETECLWDSNNIVLPCTINVPPPSISFIASIAIVSMLISFPIDLSISLVIANVCRRRPRLEQIGLDSFRWMGRSVDSWRFDPLIVPVESEETAITYILCGLRAYVDAKSFSEEESRHYERIIRQLGLETTIENTLDMTYWQKLRFGDNIRACVGHYVHQAGLQANDIVRSISSFGGMESHLKDYYLIQSFALEQFDFIERYVLRQHCFQFSRDEPKEIHPLLWAAGWLYVLGAIFFFMYYALIWGATNNGLTTASWGAILSIEVAITFFVVSTLRIAVINVLAMRWIRPKLRQIVNNACTLTEIALRSFENGPELNVKKLVQYLSPTCMAAQHLHDNDVYMGKFLRMMNDEDMILFIPSEVLRQHDEEEEEEEEERLQYAESNNPIIHDIELGIDDYDTPPALSGAMPIPLTSAVIHEPLVPSPIREVLVERVVESNSRSEKASETKLTLAPDDLRLMTEGINILHKETYLEDRAFEGLFGMTTEKFYELPKWEQLARKKALGLF